MCPLTTPHCRRAAGLWDDVASLRSALDRLHSQVNEAQAANRANTAYIDARVETGLDGTRKSVRHALREVIQRVATQLDQLAGDTHSQVATLRAEQGATRTLVEHCAARVQVLSEALASKDAQLVRLIACLKPARLALKCSTLRTGTPCRQRLHAAIRRGAPARFLGRPSSRHGAVDRRSAGNDSRAA